MKKLTTIILASINLIACTNTKELHNRNIEQSKQIDESTKMSYCISAWSKKECKKINLDDIIIATKIDEYIANTYEIIEVDNGVYLYDLNFKK